MASDHSSSWNARYEAAARRLDDIAYLVESRHRIEALLHAQEASADFFGTEAALSGAGHVGLFSGTFNPLTLAHTALVEAAETSGGIERVLWTIAVASVDKESLARATLVDRLVQIVAYIAAEPSGGVAIVNRGLYVDEVDVVRAHIPGELVVLVGYDKIVQILDPHYYSDRAQALHELFSRARFLVAPRDTAGAGELEALFDRPENRAYRSQVSYLPLARRYREDSATAARKQAGEPGVTAGALGRVLPPEGVALALETRAYTEITSESEDEYFWRTTWITALGSVALPEAAGLPGMKRVVKATMDATARGSTLRASLRAAVAEPARSRDLLSLLESI